MEVEVVESRAAREAGCAGQLQTPFAAMGGQSPREVVLDGEWRTTPLLRCRSVTGPDPDSGSFTDGGAASLAEVQALLDAAPTVVSDSCRRTATAFTVISTADEQSLYVETDGCRRVRLM